MANRFIGGSLTSNLKSTSAFSSRTSSGTYFDKTGTLVTATSNQPRLNYSFVGSPIGTRYSTSFNGSAYLNTAVSANLSLGTSSFTVEYWVYFTSFATSSVAVSGGGSAATYDPLFGYGTSSYLLYLSSNGSSWDISNGTTIGTVALNRWYHVAIVRNVNAFSTYLNGVQGGTFTSSASIYQSTNAFLIGRGQTQNLNGLVSNVRVVKGVAVYTGNFTVPTSPLTSTQTSGTNITAITGTSTSLLTCQNDTFIDNSTNNITITNNSGVTATPNLPPLNYTSDFSGTGWSNPTTLIEPASTNIITYSEQIDNAAWSKIASGARTGITANAATAPDGNTTADLVYVVNGQTSVSGGAYWPYTFTTGVTYTWSCYFKAAGYTYVYMGSDNSNASCAWFNLATGTVGTASTGFRGTITTAGNGWYRCAVTFTFAPASMGNAGPIMGCANIDGTTTLTQAGNGSNGVYMWGAQMETNSLGATSYIPTVASAVTRAADVVGPGTSGIYSLEDRQNSTANDDQFTVQSFSNVGSNYNWTAPEDVVSVEVLVVAGGGSGGRGYGGGGGAGGLVYNTAYPVTPGVTYPIVIGAGGVSQPTGGADIKGNNGSNSQFGTIVAIGGGGGGAESDGFNGRAGGSGGGAGYNGTSGGGAGVAGQGNRGGNGIGGGGHYPNAGGGGAGQAGLSPLNVTVGGYAGTGGAGLGFNISGTLTYYAGGGGGGAGYDSGGGLGGIGGIGGGGAGAGDGIAGGSTSVGVAGTANTGGGGGGGNGSNYASGAGGSGIVVVKYKRTNRQLAVTSNAAVVTQKFSVNNTWTVPTGVTSVEVLVVAGGGGGGAPGGSGGGAGGLIYNSTYSVTPGGNCSVVIGASGTGGVYNSSPGGKGGNSVFARSSDNIVTNGSFDTDTGWTHTLTSIANGYMYLNAGAQPRPTNTSLTASTGSYLLTWTVVSNPGGHSASLDDDGAGAGVGSVTTYVSGISAVGIYSAVVSKTASTRLRILGSGTFTSSMIFDNVFMYPVSSIISATGGGGGGGNGASAVNANGGSGAGAAPGYVGGSAGTGVAGQGFAGGASGNVGYGGGGGAGGAGQPGNDTVGGGKGGDGGPGLPFNITGNLEYYAGGGGGGVYTPTGTLPGYGGIGGGGSGTITNVLFNAGAPNTGGGGGGVGGGSGAGGPGGSGVVVLRYRVPQIATFLDSGAWTCPAGVTSVQALIVAGGGGTVGTSNNYTGGGGGGGVVYSTSVSVTPGVTYPVIIGEGGKSVGGLVDGDDIAWTATTAGQSGGNSSFAGIVAIGGGGCGASSSSVGTLGNGQPGGSGGGGSGPAGGTGGAGIYAQGNTGGASGGSTSGAGGGGGGAGAVGTAGSGTTGGNGGVGLAYSISGTATYYGGGGGGSAGTIQGTGGLGGGATANVTNGGPRPNGTPNTGGGAGGKNFNPAGRGGSGIVIIRWIGG